MLCKKKMIRFLKVYRLLRSKPSYRKRVRNASFQKLVDNIEESAPSYGGRVRTQQKVSFSMEKLKERMEEVNTYFFECIRFSFVWTRSLASGTLFASFFLEILEY